MKGPSISRETVMHNVIRPCFRWACKPCSESSRHDCQSQEIYIHIPALLLATCWYWDKFLASLCFGVPLVSKDSIIPSSGAKKPNATLMFGDCIKEGGRELSSNAVLPWRPPHHQVLALSWRLQGLGQLPQRWLVGETVHFFMQTQSHVLTEEVFEVASSIKPRWKNKPLAGVWSLPRHPSTPAVSALHYHRGKPNSMMALKTGVGPEEQMMFHQSSWGTDQACSKPGLWVCTCTLEVGSDGVSISNASLDLWLREDSHKQFLGSEL